MSSAAEIQAAVERLPSAERLALFHWLEQTKDVRAEKLTALRALIDEGDRDLAEGRFTTLESDDDFRALGDDIRQRSRERLGQGA